MNGIFQLWLPILASAVLIFIASNLIHMIFKWHNSGYQKMVNEDDVRAVIRADAPLPGQYILPHCKDRKDMQDAAMQNKFIGGPNAFVTVRKNGRPTMGLALVL